MKNTEKTMDQIVALCKGRGFVYPGSEIYGGLANSWDYGPLGVELKNNVKRAWWKKFVQENPYNVGLDAAILMNPQTWVASGHLGGFSDPLMDCKECKERFRADKVIEGWCEENNFDLGKSVDALSQADEGLCGRAQHRLPLLRRGVELPRLRHPEGGGGAPRRLSGAGDPADGHRHRLRHPEPREACLLYTSPSPRDA